MGNGEINDWSDSIIFFIIIDALFSDGINGGIRAQKGDENGGNFVKKSRTNEKGIDLIQCNLM